MPFTRVTKRKLEANNSGKENKALKAKGREIKGTEDAPDKGQLNSKLKSLQLKYEALKNENNKNLALIIELKSKVARLENEKLPKKNKSIDSQTVSDFDFGIEFPCKECIFQASCEDELRWHLSSEHEHENGSDYENLFSCNVCDHKSASKGDLMTHRKQSHPQTIKMCRYFIQGNCAFDAQVCWYSHDQSIKYTTAQTLKEFKCSFCGKAFQSKSAFMKHRKDEHQKTISECRNDKNGWCRFSAEKCWYKHEEFTFNNQGNDNQPPEMISRLFTMMEAYQERIETLENQI